MSIYAPAAVVVQCGVDGLAGDPIGGRPLGLGLQQMGDCLSSILKLSQSMECKVLLLGGGGYHRGNASKAWTYFTSLAVSTTLPLILESFFFSLFCSTLSARVEWKLWMITHRS